MTLQDCIFIYTVFASATGNIRCWLLSTELFTAVNGSAGYCQPGCWQ